MLGRSHPQRPQLPLTPKPGSGKVGAPRCRQSILDSHRKSTADTLTASSRMPDSTPPQTASSKSHPSNALDAQYLTSEKVLFLEEKTKEYFDYILDCYHKTRAEGNNVLQWLFAVILGGLAMSGTLYKEGYWPLSWGAFAAAGWATYLAIILVPKLNPQSTMPPGNLAEYLNKRLSASTEQMRWEEATRMDYRIGVNREAANTVANAVSEARKKLTYLPGVFMAGIALSIAAWSLWQGIVWMATVNRIE